MINLLNNICTILLITMVRIINFLSLNGNKRLVLKHQLNYAIGKFVEFCH